MRSAAEPSAAGEVTVTRCTVGRLEKGHAMRMCSCDAKGAFSSCGESVVECVSLRMMQVSCYCAVTWCRSWSSERRVRAP